MRTWLDPRNNSLNLIRLVFALMVLFHHVGPVTQLVGEFEITPGESVGAWAVFGFFMISGYLITAARLRSDVGRYLKNRVVRIFPAFLFINVVTAFLLAPFVYLLDHGTLDGYLTTGPTPISYILGNFFLYMNQWGIADTLHNVPYPIAWNGSLWSLYYEFVCYLIVGALLTIPFFKRHIWPTAAIFLGTCALRVFLPTATVYLGTMNGTHDQLSRLLPFFFGGSLLFLAKDRLSLTTWGALGAAVAAVAIMVVAPHSGPQISAPLLTYVLLWIGQTLPSPRLFQVHDFSYGIYIWGFPLTQLLTRLGLADAAPYLVFCAVLFVLTALGAAFSWFLVERPAMRASRGKKNPFGELRAPAR